MTFLRARAESREAAAVSSTIESRPPETARTAGPPFPSAASTARSTSDTATRAYAMILLIYLMHGGVSLGNARPAGHAVGVVRPHRVLPRADLAELIARHVSNPVVHDSGDVAPRLAQAEKGRAERGLRDGTLPGIERLIVGAIAQNRAHVVTRLDEGDAFREYLRIGRPCFARPFFHTRLARVIGSKDLHHLWISVRQTTQVSGSKLDVCGGLIEEIRIPRTDSFRARDCFSDRRH